MTTAKICEVDGCGKACDQGRRGFCMAHYKRWYKYGDPLGGKRGPRAANGEPLQWLLSHVSYEGEDCLKWPFGERGCGYGAILTIDGKLDGAHRYMCIQAHGEPPKGLVARHKCRNGQNGCVNPRHIEWGSHTDNMRDRLRDGTACRGSENAFAKLSEDDVLQIRALRGSMRQADIATKFGVSQAHVSKIQLNGGWQWLTQESDIPTGSNE